VGVLCGLHALGYLHVHRDVMVFACYDVKYNLSSDG
jgi:hypothetical protein